MDSKENYVSLQENDKEIDVQTNDQSETQDFQKLSIEGGSIPQKSNKKDGGEQNDKNKKESEKAKAPGKSLKRLLGYTWDHKTFLIAGLIGLVVSSLSQVYVPYLSGQIINVIVVDKSMDKLQNKSLIFIGVAIVGGVFSFIRGACFNLMGEKVMYDVRTELYSKILRKDTEFFDINKSGELMSRITSDTTLLQSAASDSISILLRNFTSLIGSIIFLLVISWKLTLIMFAVVPIVVIIVGIFIFFYKKYTVAYQDNLSKANGFATEAIGNIRVVKSFGTEKKESHQFENSMLNTYLVGKSRAVAYGLFLGVVYVIAMLCILIVQYFGGKMVIEGTLDIGDLSSFVLYTITMATSLIATGNVMNNMVTAIGVAEKLFGIMDTEVKIKHGIVKPKQIKGEIQFKDVEFKYPTKDDVTVLKKVNFTIKQGNTVAFVGKSGSGKSSVISLIERFYDINEGLISLDGLDIRDIDQEWLHQNIGFVSQEPTLFSGTLRENITYGITKEATDEEIRKAYEMANAADFIEDKSLFPEGLETVVGERGVKLSGGQKQRIAIARAIIKNPAILIFDEATSALDAESEYKVQFAIDQLVKQGEKTIIIIAHRLSTIINCKQIIVIQKGNIVEQGNHQQLLEANNVYAKLIQRQLSQYKKGDNDGSDNQDIEDDDESDQLISKNDI